MAKYSRVLSACRWQIFIELGVIKKEYRIQVPSGGAEYVMGAPKSPYMRVRTIRCKEAVDLLFITTTSVGLIYLAALIAPRFIAHDHG